MGLARYGGSPEREGKRMTLFVLLRSEIKTGSFCMEEVRRELISGGRSHGIYERRHDQVSRRPRAQSYSIPYRGAAVVTSSHTRRAAKWGEMMITIGRQVGCRRAVEKEKKQWGVVNKAGDWWDFVQVGDRFGRAVGGAGGVAGLIVCAMEVGHSLRRWVAGNEEHVLEALGSISWLHIGVAAFCVFVVVLIRSSQTKKGSGSGNGGNNVESVVMVKPPAKVSEDVDEDEKSGERLSDGGDENDREKLDCIVVGAGVAGAALAHTLGKDGRRVLVIERDLTEPDRIVGELLQPGGYLKLVELGLADCVDGIDAQKVFGYALFKDGRDAKVGYPLEGMADDIAGRSFHNGRFIQKMRAKAASLKTVELQQGTVLSLIEESGSVTGVRYKSFAEDGSSLVVEAFAPLTFVCDGCFSNLRRNLCTPQVDVPSCFVGLVLENCDLPHASHGHVVLADPSTILFYPISCTEVRCLVDVPGQKVPSIANGDMAKYLTEQVAPQLPEKLRGPFIASVVKGHIRTMPNKSMPAIPRPTPGALLMGDAFNMRHPLTGGGMTVALSDILVLRDMLKPVPDFHDVSALCEYLKAFYTRRKPVASTINTLAGALYKVFVASTDEGSKEMRQACFDYLSLGGVFSTGPVALLSGLNPSPLSLVIHFFAVALFGVGRLMMPFPSFKRMWIGVRLIQGASKIIIPIIWAEGILQMFFPGLLPDHYKTPPLQ